MMNRRSFLRRGALAGATLPLMAGGLPMRAFADQLGSSPFARASDQQSDRILVILRLDGGSDGLNSLVPYHDDEYYRARRRGLSNDISIHPETVTPIHGSSTLGLHPSLAPLAPLFDEEKIAVVQNVGYENAVMSHFRSTEIWMSASNAGEFVGTGWLGRSFERQHRAYRSVAGDAPYAIEFSTRLSTAFLGDHGDIGMAHTEINYLPDIPEEQSLYSGRAGSERRHVESIMRESNTFSRSILAARERVASNRVAYPTDFPISDGVRFSHQLAETARLIASGLATQIYLVTLPFYDFHIRQLPRERNQHDAFARSVLAFQRDLEAFGVADRVTMLTISEFGRRVESQGTGTDHGGAAPLMVIGHGVAPGFIGHDPDIGSLVGPGNLRMQFDFRQVYASVLDQWLRTPTDAISAGLLDRYYSQLPIFRRPPVARASGDALLGECVPNPASRRTVLQVRDVRSNTASFSIYAAGGRRAHTRAVDPGTSAISVDVSGMASGTYVCELVDGERRTTRRLIVVGD